MREIDYVQMGKRIREQRLKYKLTQEKLAEKVDVAPSYISEIERGTSICSLSVLVRIADVLELNLDNLVCGVNISNVDTTFKELLRNIPNKNHRLYIELCTNIANVLKDKK